jgi:hypothetical protein
MGLAATLHFIFQIAFWTYAVLQLAAILLPRGRWKLFGLFGLVIPLGCCIEIGGGRDSSGQVWLGMMIVTFFSLIFHNIIWMVDRSIGD